MSSSLQLLDLPDIVLEKILSFLSYDTIASDRLVCKKFDRHCRALLNRGFLQAERKQVAVSRTIKSCLPRRESERRGHPLARHCEILAALETRISMLNMTFMKFIQNGLCCFIPGKIIDEILYILRVVQSYTNPPRTHDLLQELRDISSMAMEHFEEHIVPSLKNNEIASNKGYNLPGTSLVITRMPRPMIPELLRKELRNFHQLSRSHNNQLCGLKKLIKSMSVKIKRQNNLLSYQSSRLREQKRINQQQATDIADMKRHLEELDVKFATLSTELAQNRLEKSNENKASQTTEIDEHTDELNFEFPWISLQHENLKDSIKDNLRHDDLEERIKRTLSASISVDKLPLKNIESEIILRRIRNNIKPRSRIHLQSRYPKITPNIKPRMALVNSRSSFDILRMKDVSSIKKPCRRETISDFRLNQSNTHAYKVTKTHTQDKNNYNNRRRVINLIANIADSKVAKQNIEDQSEIAKILDEFPKKNDDAVGDSGILHRGTKRTLNDSDQYHPHKLFVESND